MVAEFDPPKLDPASVVWVVRHAEKASDGDDPPLTEAGQARAEALAALLADEPIVAVYSTPYQRTQQTAAPTAEAHGLTVLEYDPRSDLPALLIAEHLGQAVLITGHSNTVPGIVAGLGVTPAPEEIPHERYGDLYRVTITGPKVELELSRFGG
jgi:2,3-bisphosphoglycerate-dependent phosphoglycerate mutase